MVSKFLKYQFIANDIQEKIGKGDYKKGEIIPPENELAKIYDVSRITIRKALYILDKKGVIRKLPGVGSIVNETPSGTDSGLIDKYSARLKELDIEKNIGVFISIKIGYKEDPFYAIIANGMEEESNRRGYNLVLAIQEQHRRNYDLAKLFMEKNLVGALLVGEVDKEFVDGIRKYKIPIVFVNTVMNGENIPAVINDDFRGGYEATKHLLETGCKRIACITGLREAFSSVERVKGYKVCLQRYNINIDSKYIVEGDFHTASGYKAMKSLCEHKHTPDGVFVLSDNMAIGAMKFVKEIGLNIPKDISIISFDNNPESTMTVPPLTTINVQKEEMGRLSVFRLVAAIEGKDLPNKIVLPTDLVVRKSTRKI